MQRFLPFLPDGEAAGEGGEALAVIADDLEWLLSVEAAELWAVARSDPSLALLVASFLQYAKSVGMRNGWLYMFCWLGLPVFFFLGGGGAA